MAKVSSKAKKRTNNSKLEKPRNINRILISLPIIAFLLKMTVLSKVQTMGYNGSDFENYFNSTNGLLRDGFFSKEPLLSYFPAGYPILIWPIALISIGGAQTILSVIQSVFFAYATFYFTNKLKNINLSGFAILSSLLISFNPTLSLASLTVGYEANTAACLMMAIGILFTKNDSDSNKKIYSKAALVAFWLGLGSFMQPRYLLASLLIITVYIFYQISADVKLKVIAVSLVVLSVFPSILVMRNSVAINQQIISTNLGVTMRIGAGAETDGSYERQGPEVPCKPATESDSLSDSDLVKCVISWYLNNPSKSIELALNKARYFWTPWAGPLQKGTVGRNPALIYSPVMALNRSSEAWHDFIYGGFGKFISYLWMLGQLVLLVLGLKKLFSLNRRFAFVISAPVLVAWLISIATIGDSRFRIPTMSLSLVLQAAGILWLREKAIKGK